MTGIEKHRDILHSMTDTETFEVIDEAMRKILHRYGPDHRIDSHERLAEYAVGLIRAERERCARIADDLAGLARGLEHDAVNKELDQQIGLTYSVGYGIAAQRIAARIRSGEE